MATGEIPRHQYVDDSYSYLQDYFHVLFRQADGDKMVAYHTLRRDWGLVAPKGFRLDPAFVDSQPPLIVYTPFGEFSFNRSNNEVQSPLGGKIILKGYGLTQPEILSLLLANAPEPVSYQRLITAGWQLPDDYPIGLTEIHNLSMYISRLRKRLKDVRDKDDDYRFIRTRIGLGYYFNGELKAA